MGKVGRAIANDIILFEESVSRFHAEINFKNNCFYVRDIGSNSGTFIKIQKIINLKENMIIELGSKHFYIEKIENFKEESENLKILIKFSILDLINNKEEIFFANFENLNTKYSIGRNSCNSINFPDDLHLSNIHASLFILDNNVFLEDLGSTNG